jgi:mono/diheme cytochrome c family protein
VLVVLCVLALGAGGGIGYLLLAGPKMRPASQMKVEATPERLERGKYLFEKVCDCQGCHSPHDMTKFGMPVVPDKVGSGYEFPPELGLPGKVVAPNITSDPETGIGQWTDGEKIRAIREGIGRDGKPLFSFMPYQGFRKMSDEDVYSIVAYLGRLAPVKNRLPPTELDFPVSIFSKFDPAPVEAPVATPAKSDRLKYGGYLVTIGGCVDCHSQQDKGKPKAGLEYAGGFELRIKPYLVRSANITPDEETGIGKWTEERFLAKFKGYSNLNYENAPKSSQANFTLMPWYGLSQLQEDDLKAIYAHLRTLTPVRNPVEVHPPVAD